MHTFIAVLTATLAAIAGGLAGASSAQASETDSTYAVSGCLGGGGAREPTRDGGERGGEHRDERVHEHS